MAELIAQGERPEDRWERELPEGQAVVLGRAGQGWSIPWDARVSRQQAELTWSAGKLHVRRLAGARGPLFFRGREDNHFELRPGEVFVAGHTVLSLRAAEVPSPVGPPVIQARTIQPGELEKVPFRDAPHRIDVLSRLPGVIGSASGDAELAEQLVSLLLAGIARAGVVGVVRLGTGDPTSVEVVRWDHRPSAAGASRPSHRLVREALQEQHSTVLHVWSAEGAPAPQFTVQGDCDWAFCVPVRGEAGKGWGLYVAGRLPTEGAATLLAPWASNELGDDLKFAELVAAIVSSLRHAQVLQHRQAVLSHFFSPALLPVLTGTGPESVLKPRQTETTVLFCDLRGFSRKVEVAADDLFGVLERVSKALGVMTRNILEHKGVIADFQGDAAMAFWGWPQDWPDRAALACRAALAIRARFEELGRDAGHLLAGFQAGIGIATGTAVAGQIGTDDQAKVTVFGSVVNLASRLEGMTKLLRVPVLLDEVTARLAAEQLPAAEGRCRRLALVKPYGLQTPVLVSELLPPAAQRPHLTDEHLGHYESALEAFLKGDWSAAYERLHRVPPQDHGKDLLLGFILAHNHTPPPGWDGVVPLESKS